jgi:integrase
VQASGDTAVAAPRALKAKCVDRNLIAPSAGSLTADSPLPDLVAYSLEDIDLEDRTATATRQLYERDMRTLVLPAFKDLTLREIGVARCDQFLKRLAKDSYSKAKHARVVLRLAVALAVRHEVLLRNPVDHVARLHGDARMPDAFTPEEITGIRAAIAYWEAGRDVSGPKPDGRLGAIVEVILGTSARIGEVLAIRRRDIDLSVPSVRISGTIISPKGEPTTRQDHPKTVKPRLLRTIRLPGFAATAVQRRLNQLNTIDPDALLFCSREGTPLTTINEHAGVELASQ